MEIHFLEAAILGLSIHFRFSHLQTSVKQKSGATENQEIIIFNSGVNIFLWIFLVSIRT